MSGPCECWACLPGSDDRRAEAERARQHQDAQQLILSVQARQAQDEMQRTQFRGPATPDEGER